MSEVSQIKTPYLSLKSEERLALILKIRQSRRTTKASKTGEGVERIKKTSAKVILANIGPEAALKLLNELKGMQ